MKLVYSHLQKFLPDLNVKPHQLRDDLTMIGHFTNFFEETDNEIIFDLDIKVNRGDCLGYYGLARDLAVLYNLKLHDLTTDLLSNNSLPQLPITITTNKVKRVMAVKISQLKNQISPKWLQTFIKFHNTNPVNLIVDLSNYVMFMYGIPNHAFDVYKSGSNLIWEINPKYKEFISLDNSRLKLNSDILMINNPKKALSLSFWGGEACAINLDTTDIIIEVAIYDPTTVRQNSRFLKSTTEAATRLEKLLDPKTIPLAFNFLTKLLLEHCQGQISSQIFDYYPKPDPLPVIKFDPSSPSQISGINIPVNFTLDCLTRLGCSLSTHNQLVSVTPPSIRQDLTISQSLTNESIRFWGYHQIPTNQPLSPKKITDITPKEIYLIDLIKDRLTALGYNEVLTWPLTDTVNDPKTVVKTQNSINTEVVYLRQSLIPSLKHQVDQYLRFKLPPTQFFEIGKIFFKTANQYLEKNALAIYNSDPKKLVDDLKHLDLNTNIIDDNFTEIILDNLDKPQQYQPIISSSHAYQLTRQIITLDANITLDTKKDPFKLITKYSKIINSEHLWQLTITDIYHDQITQKYRYTFQASYFNLDDKTAKEIHLKAFNLK